MLAFYSIVLKTIINPGLSTCRYSLLPLSWDMYLCCDADTERAVGLLRQYQANLTSPSEQALKTSVGKVSAILGSELFQALLGKKNIVKLPVLKKRVFHNSALTCITSGFFSGWTFKITFPAHVPLFECFYTQYSISLFSVSFTLRVVFPCDWLQENTGCRQGQVVLICMGS